MRLVKVGLSIVGLAVIAWSIHHIGWAPVLEALARLTWWQVVLVCLPYAAIMAVDTLGWRFAFPGDAAPFRRLFGARLAGEALNLVTAVGSVGGEAVKAWLMPATDSRVITAMLWLLVVEVAAVAGFVAVQVVGVVGRAGRLLEWFGVVTPGAYAQQLDTALRDYYRRDWRRLVWSTGFHLAGWLLGAVEAFVILVFLGIPADLVTATVIEALGAGVRFATFLVPASLGAFESANAAAFEAMGLGAGAGLAFSFVRRARQVVWIAIGMLALAAMSWRAKRAGLQPTVSSGTSSSPSS